MTTTLENVQTRELLTVDEAAESLRVSRSMVYKLVSSRILPSVRVGPGTIRIERGELAEWIGERRSSGGGSSPLSTPSASVERGGAPGRAGRRGDPPPLTTAPSPKRGGWLFAHAGDSDLVVLTTGPGGDGRSGYATMEIGYEDWDAVKRLAPHLAPIGDWHLHPTADTLPSRQDRRAWGRGCDLTGSHWLGLVFAPPADMWSEAECASFITFGTKTAMGCEPLRLVEF